MRARLVLWLALLLFTLSACHGGRARHGADADSLGPLIDLVPAGPSWLIQARPVLLAQQGAAMSLWRALVTEERERELARRTGIDPLTVDELVAVELPNHGYLLLLRGPFDAHEVVVRAGDRLALRDVVSERPTRREGLAGQGRYAYAAIASNAVLIAKDAPPDLVASYLARRTDPSAPGAVAGDDARALLAEHGSSAAVVVAPKPLTLEPGTGVALLFARERALAVSVQPNASVLPVAIDMRGEFPPGAENNFRALAKSIAGAPLGRALGLSRVPENMAIRVDKQGAVVTFALIADDLLAGVRMLFFDDLRALFES